MGVVPVYNAFGRLLSRLLQCVQVVNVYGDMGASAHSLPTRQALQAQIEDVNLVWHVGDMR